MEMFNLRDYYEGTKEEHIQKMASFEYEMIKWYDHITEFPDTRIESILGEKDGNQIVRHDRFDGNIFQEGTPIDAQNLGYMDYSLYLAWQMLRTMWEQLTAMRLQMAVILQQNQNNMPHNMFYASARNIDVDLIILEGYYDAINGRGVV